MLIIFPLQAFAITFFTTVLRVVTHAAISSDLVAWHCVRALKKWIHFPIDFHLDRFIYGSNRSIKRTNPLTVEI